MVDIPERITQSYDRSTVMSLNKRVSGAVCRENVMSLNKPKIPGDGRDGRPEARQPSAQGAYGRGSRPEVQQPVTQAAYSRDSRPEVQQPVTQAAYSRDSRPAEQPPRPDSFRPPELVNVLARGQKTLLDPRGGIRKVKACFGWNVTDSRCDVDASAFLVGASGKVPDDSWFVFYSQPESPDGSVDFSEDGSRRDREVFRVDLDRVNPEIRKIIFVLTINEAFENNLNFSMIKNAYVRILDAETDRELLSYRMAEAFANVTSMTIGELYSHNGQWKFNPVGNGVHQDLAGQCAIYGVEIE